MAGNNNQYTPISVINSTQLIRAGYIRHTEFSREMYRNFRDSSYEKNIIIMPNTIVLHMIMKKIGLVIYL